MLEPDSSTPKDNSPNEAAPIPTDEQITNVSEAAAEPTGGKCSLVKGKYDKISRGKYLFWRLEHEMSRKNIVHIRIIKPNNFTHCIYCSAELQYCRHVSMWHQNVHIYFI